MKSAGTVFALLFAALLAAQTNRGGITGTVFDQTGAVVTVPLPANFFGMNANSFDITTLDAFRLYRLRQALGTTGLYTPNGQSRYIQLGLKIFF